MERLSQCIRPTSVFSFLPPQNSHFFKNEKTGYDTKSLIKLRNILLYRFLFLTFAVSENEITHDEERNTIDC